MLIHHFEAETQGFRKITFSERNIFLRGLRRGESRRIKATSSPMHIINENIFLSSRWQTRANRLFVKYIKIY